MKTLKKLLNKFLESYDRTTALAIGDELFSSFASPAMFM